MNGKAQRTARLNYSSAESNDVIYRVPPRTVYIHRAAGSTPNYIVGLRNRRQKVSWAEAKAQKHTMEAALQSAAVWRLRAEKNYDRAYRVVILPRAVLAHIGTVMIADRGMGTAIVNYAADSVTAADFAHSRGRAFVPPELLPAIEAIATSGESNRFYLAISFLGWNAWVLQPPAPTFEQMLAPRLPAAVELDDAEDADGQAGEQDARHYG